MAFAEKWKTKPTAEVIAQIQRLEGMKSGKMKPELMDWLKARIAVLKQYPFTPPEVVCSALTCEICPPLHSYPHRTICIDHPQDKEL